jgi:hypothetical protein
MALPPFDPEWFLEKSDEELGGLLLAFAIGQQADIRGIPIDQITEEFKYQARRYILTIEAVNAESTATEKALHKAAS